MSLFNSNLSFVTLNARGLRDSIKRKATFLYLKSEKAQAYLVQETYSNETDENFGQINGEIRYCLVMVQTGQQVLPYS